MIRGGEVEIEGGKLTFEEQLALAEAAEKAKQEQEAAEQKEREDAWNAYKAEQLSLATAKAATLTASTAPIILAEVNKAKAKEPWLRAEVSNSKKRIEDNIAQIASTIDPDEQPLYDMLIAPNVSTTLGSDVTVSHEYGNGGVLVPGAFALTASGASYDLMNVPPLIRANINPVREPGGKRFMRRLERVN